MSLDQHYQTFCSIDPVWALEQAEGIINDFPISESANASGKFFSNYHTWHFHKTSQLPLFRELTVQLQRCAPGFWQRWNRKLNFEFFIISYVENASEESCLFHRDGYFFDGQFHFTVLGQANIETELEQGLIKVPNGTLWYFDSSKVRHRIRPTHGRRIEVCIPLDLREDIVVAKNHAVSPNPSAWLDGSNSAWMLKRQECQKYVTDAVDRGTASNKKIASFALGAEGQ